VQEECLNYALKNDIEEGIWGGMTGNQRRIYAQKLRKESLQRI